MVAVVRPGGAARAPAATLVAEADVLDAASLADVLDTGDTLVHLVGTPRPSPAKGAEFRAVDLPSIVASTDAASRRGVGQLVYVSVAHPAPIMRDYIRVRREGEARVAATGLPATVLRPWYVLGPGHRWPCLLVPAYWLARAVPASRDAAARLGLITRDEMVRALVWGVEHPPARGVRVLDVPAIKAIPR